jgi:hypothetical protein
MPKGKGSEYIGRSSSAFPLFYSHATEVHPAPARKITTERVNTRFELNGRFPKVMGLLCTLSRWTGVHRTAERMSVHTLDCVDSFNGSVAPLTPTPPAPVDSLVSSGMSPGSSRCSGRTISVTLVARCSGRTATPCSSLGPGREPAPSVCSPGC